MSKLLDCRICTLIQQNLIVSSTSKRGMDSSVSQNYIALLRLSNMTCLHIVQFNNIINGNWLSFCAARMVINAMEADTFPATLFIHNGEKQFLFSAMTALKFTGLTLCTFVTLMAHLRKR